MTDNISIETLDRLREVVADCARGYSRRLRGSRHCDIRLEVRETKSAQSENGEDKASGEERSASLGVRVLAGTTTTAAGYYGAILGAKDLEDIQVVLRQAVGHAHDRALANANRKTQVRAAYGSLGGALWDADLAPVEVRQDGVAAHYRRDPRSIPLRDVSKFAREVSKTMSGVEGVVYSVAGVQTGLQRQVFASSEGALIDQSMALSEGLAFVVATGEHGPLELYDYSGHQGGWEVLDEGLISEYVRLVDFRTFALDLAKDAAEVATAEPLKPPDKDVVIVTDPHYNALLVHEVIGHPSELDRALKYETSYAGRSWFFKDMANNQIGKQVASPLVNVFSDPTIDGLGHYLYDNEGTPAKRAWHFRNGVFEEFVNSRQTASIMGVRPNGHYVATDASLVPLIRMSNTAFAPGDRDPADIAREVERGYYVSGHRVPSVAESRENFRISAMKVYEIHNGQLGQLYRDGGVTSDSRDYFMSIDAVGRDFRLFPIPNCGKGQPMQARRMGNGGPTLRSTGRMTGVSR